MWLGIKAKHLTMKVFFPEQQYLLHNTQSQQEDGQMTLEDILEIQYLKMPLQERTYDKKANNAFDMESAKPKCETCTTTWNVHLEIWLYSALAFLYLAAMCLLISYLIQHCLYKAPFHPILSGYICLWAIESKKGHDLNSNTDLTS